MELFRSVFPALSESSKRADSLVKLHPHLQSCTVGGGRVICPASVTDRFTFERSQRDLKLQRKQCIAYMEKESLNYMAKSKRTTEYYVCVSLSNTSCWKSGCLSVAMTV